MENKWEYKVIKSRRMARHTLEKRLNSMGQNGWELISSSAYSLGAVMFLFRRRC